jgi:hypothetical protein
MITMGILPYQGKIPIVQPEIEPGTSGLVVRDAAHRPRGWSFLRNVWTSMLSYRVQ